MLNGYAIHMIESHLVINVNSTESYGNYSCQANNTVGTAERAFELMPLGKRLSSDNVVTYMHHQHFVIKYLVGVFYM